MENLNTYIQLLIYCDITQEYTYIIFEGCEPEYQVIYYKQVKCKNTKSQ